MQFAEYCAIFHQFYMVRNFRHSKGDHQFDTLGLICSLFIKAFDLEPKLDVKESMIKWYPQKRSIGMIHRFLYPQYNSVDTKGSELHQL